VLAGKKKLLGAAPRGGAASHGDTYLVELE